MNTEQEHRAVGERRRVRRLVTAFLFVAGMGFGALLRNQIPAPALAQSSPNVAIREPSSSDTRIAVIEERLRGLDTALALQAGKYEDRLEALNNSHALAVKVQEANKDNFVSKDEYKGMVQWRETIEKRLTTMEAARGGASAFNAGLVAYLLLAAMLVNLALNWIRLKRPEQKK